VTGISNKSTSQIRGGHIKGDTGGFNSVELIGSPGYIIPVRIVAIVGMFFVVVFETSGWLKLITE